MGERDIWEVCNQLGGYVGPDTEERLARFLLREAKAAENLANEIARLRAEVERLTQRCAEWAASYGGKCSEFEDAKRREAEAFERAAQIAEAATVQVKHEPFDKYIDEPIPHRGTIASLIRQAGKDGGGA